MKLLVEKIHDVAYSAIEEAEGKKSMYIEGIYLQSEIKNKNGRIYPKGVMEEAVAQYITNKVQSGVAYGELTHPQGPNINPDRVCHRITELRWDGNNVIGKSKVGGPMGQSVLQLMELGGKIGVSSRGLGSLKTNKDGIMEVQNDYKIATAADVVLDPSAPDAFVKGIMEDTREWVLRNGVWTEEKVEETKSEMKKMSKRELNEAKLRIFQHFLEEVSKK